MKHINVVKCQQFANQVVSQLEKAKKPMRGNVCSAMEEEKPRWRRQDDVAQEACVGRSPPFAPGLQEQLVQPTQHVMHPDAAAAEPLLKQPWKALGKVRGAAGYLPSRALPRDSSPAVSSCPSLKANENAEAS